YLDDHRVEPAFDRGVEDAEVVGALSGGRLAGAGGPVDVLHGGDPHPAQLTLGAGRVGRAVGGGRRGRGFRAGLRGDPGRCAVRAPLGRALLVGPRPGAEQVGDGGRGHGDGRGGEQGFSGTVGLPLSGSHAAQSRIAARPLRRKGRNRFSILWCGAGKGRAPAACSPGRMNARCGRDGQSSAAVTLLARCDGSGSYRRKVRRKVPVPWDSERRSIAYLVISSWGTSARTSVRPVPTGSVPSTLPRREERSDITGPTYSSATRTDTSSTGSSSSTGTLVAASFSASWPAIWKAMSEESTEWALPS